MLEEMIENVLKTMAGRLTIEVVAVHTIPVTYDYWLVVKYKGATDSFVILKNRIGTVNSIRGGNVEMAIDRCVNSKEEI